MSAAGPDRSSCREHDAWAISSRTPYASTADYVRRWSAVTGTPHTLTTTDARWPETQCIAYTGSQSGTIGKGFAVVGLSPASRFYWSCALRAAAPSGIGTSGAFLFGHDASSQDNQSNAHIQLRINPDGGDPARHHSARHLGGRGVCVPAVEPG
jgi:hypothetical protein